MEQIRSRVPSNPGIDRQLDGAARVAKELVIGVRILDRTDDRNRTPVQSDRQPGSRVHAIAHPLSQRHDGDTIANIAVRDEHTGEL